MRTLKPLISTLCSAGATPNVKVDFSLRQIFVEKNSAPFSRRSLGEEVAVIDLEVFPVSTYETN